MSKIGMSKIIYKPATFQIKENQLTLSGNFHKDVNVLINENFECKVFEKESFMQIVPKNKENVVSSEWGTLVRKIQNTIIGVTIGFKKIIKFSGVGYKIYLKNNTLEIHSGKSHFDYLQLPNGFKASVDVKNLELTLTYFDKDLLHTFVAKLIKIRPFNKYSGHGILDSSVTYIKKKKKGGKA